MAVVATTTYLYADTNLVQHFVQGTELVDRGAWSSAATYAPLEVVQIGADQYVALQTNTNTLPTGVVDENWSTLVVVEEAAGSVVTAGSDYFARTLAEQALQVAYIGTAIGSAAYDLAQDAYSIAINGTNLITIETGSRIAADLILMWAGTAESGTRSYADQVLTTALFDEAGTRSQADQVLTTAIFVEQGTRSYADQVLTTALLNEAGTRAQADQVLTTAIFVEQGTRSQADQNLQNQIDVVDITLDTVGSIAQAAYDLAAAAAFPDIGNRLISGGNTIWVSGYTFRTSPTVVDFNGTSVSFPQTDTTLATSDPTDNRLDLIVADMPSGSIIKVTGTASTPPAFPDYDPVNQFQLTFIPVDAATFDPSGITRTWIYQENVEWTWDGSATINPNSLVNPFEGTKDIEGTNVVNNQYFRMTAPTTFDAASYDILYFYVAPKANWGTRYLRINWENSGGARKGNYITVATGSFGFDSANPVYQLIAIPMSLFGISSGTAIQRLRFQTISSSGSMGYYVDNIGLQIGVATPPLTIPDATTSVKGIVLLSENGGTTATEVVQADDYRLALVQNAWSLAQAGTITHQTLTFGGTTTLDFNGSTYQTVVLTGSVQIEAVNMSLIKTITARFVASGSTWGMAFPGAWVFLTDPPTELEASKTGILSLTSFGTSYSDIVAAYAAQP